MKALKHIYQQPFIFATGIAALIHSTWALGTLFSGHAPAVDWTSWQWYEWIVPALLIAFALDVGQISTSAQIRDRGLTRARGFTFVIFAIATYYLQWLYMAVHVPLLDISAGVTGIHYDVSIELRNIGIWLVPALLPISTISYTFSGDNKQEPDTTIEYVDTTININSLEDQQDLADTEPVPVLDYDDSHLLQEPENHAVDCELCDFAKDGYSSQRYARQALKMHMKKAHGIDIDEVAS